METWVEERFIQLGFNEWQAAALVAARASWWDAKQLLDNGCSSLHAIDILT